MKKALALFLLALSIGVLGIARADGCDETYDFSEEARIASGNYPAKCDDLYQAARDVLKYLEAPSDRTPNVVMTLAVLRPIPTELENAVEQVARLKEKDEAIVRFRKAVQDCESELRGR